MGVTKNIEMREYNRSDYNLLLPKTDSYTKEETLANYTKKLLKLTESAVPDDAFLALFLGVDSYLYRVKVQLSDGTPVSGSTISGLSAVAGQTLTTGDDGIVLGKSTSASVTINCTSPYIDQKPPAAQTFTKTETITDVTLILENDTSLMRSRASKIYKFSPVVKTVDLCATGGGGGGCLSSGGGGGYTKNLMNVNLFSHSLLKFVIGSGGGAAPEPRTENGKDGGTTAVYLDNEIILQALGGKGGIYDKNGGRGGAGNGKGGNAANYGPRGGDATVPIFNDMTIGIKTGGGGGGGGGMINSQVTPPVESEIGYRGLPNGGKGAYRSLTINHDSNIPAESGVDGGGGGGGRDYDFPHAAAGGNGIIYFRFHFTP